MALLFCIISQVKRRNNLAAGHSIYRKRGVSYTPRFFATRDRIFLYLLKKHLHVLRTTPEEAPIDYSRHSGFRRRQHI